MDKLRLYTSADLLERTRPREGETKLGQQLACIRHLDELAAHPAKFVLLGLPEDIGVRANGGLAGAAGTWNAALSALCAIQSTEKLSGENLLVLGHLDMDAEMKASKSMNLSELRHLVESIDQSVADLLNVVFAAGKVPLIIGGGHNNAYPILKALAQVHQQAVNVINIDAHADFRALEGRHSGNGFSYAFTQSYVAKYAVCGLHENYNSTYLINQLRAHPHLISCSFYEDFLRGKITFEAAFEQAQQFTSGICGLEIDLDAIAGVSASAATPSGFRVEEIRKAMYQTHGNPLAYLHLCEGIAEEASQTAKLIAYLITDFVKAQA